MIKTKYAISLSALLLSACLLLVPAPARARQTTVVRTENVLPAEKPESSCSSDWLSEEPDGCLLRLEDWVLPEPPQDGGEEPGTDESEQEEQPSAANDLLSNGKKRDAFTFSAFCAGEEALDPADFSVRFYTSPPADTRSAFEEDYLRPEIEVDGELVTLVLALEEAALTLEEPTEVYIEVAWKTMAAQAVIRLIPCGQEPAALIASDEQPDDVLIAAVKDLPGSLLALRAEAAGDWRLRVSWSDTEAELGPEGTAGFEPLRLLGWQTVCEEQKTWLNGGAALLIPEDAEGCVLLDLSRTGLPEKTAGTLRIESYGALLPDALSPMPDAQLQGSFILSEEAYDEELEACVARLPVQQDWLGCTLHYRLYQLDAYASFVPVDSFMNLSEPTPEEDGLRLSLDPAAEDRLPAGSYRLTLSWALPGGAPLYESSISFFISY